MSERSTIYHCKIDPKAENSSWAMMIGYIGKPKARVLDVGCACGDFGVALKSCRDVEEVVGLELDPGSAKMALETNVYAAVHVCDLNTITVDDFRRYAGAFDYVVCGDVLEHLRDPKKTVAVLSSFLKPGGELIASIPNVAHMSIKAALLADRFNYTPSGLLDETHVHLFTFSSIARMLSECNFFIEECKWTFVDKDAWFPSDAYDLLPAYEKHYLICDPHSYVCQYVFRASQPDRGCEFSRMLQRNVDGVQITFDNAPSCIREYRDYLMNNMPVTKEQRFLAERDAAVAERDAVVAERDAVIAERDAAVAERDAAAAERDAVSADRNRLLNSTCWRMTKPMRFVLDNVKTRSYGKLARGVLKQFVPYGFMVWWLKYRYGECIDRSLLYYPGVGKRLRRVVKFLLPYGLVMLVRMPVRHLSECAVIQYSADMSAYERCRMSESEKRLYGLWKNVRDGFSPSDDDLILPPMDGRAAVAASKEVVDVIIPIYNGLPHLKRLLPALFRNTSQPHRFIFVNDCSTDAGVKDFVLNSIQNRTDCKYVENEKNLGFPGTVNHGATFVTSKYFVLLNTDVVVPENWLERLIMPMVKDETICTTTPFTNSGVFYSFPNFGENHMLSSDDDYLSCDRYFCRIGVRIDPDLEFVNGTGYCMGIRKSCWDRLGGLDAKTFGKGYGEETDLCMRYLDAGFRNVLVPNLFVYHNHGGSFASEEKKALMAAHAEIVNSRWPGFMKLLPYFVNCDPWAKFRLAVLREQYERATDCLIIDMNSRAGGACKFRQQQEQSMLASGLKVVSILYTMDKPTGWMLTFVNNDGRASFRLKDWNQAFEWIDFLSPKEVFVNNVAFCQDYRLVITRLATTPRAQFRLKYSFHDFLSCCPSFFLLGGNNRFCNYENCRNCLSMNSNRVFAVTDIDDWRSCWRKFLERCDEYRFFSENTYCLVSQIYRLPRERVTVRGHELLQKVTTVYSSPVVKEPMNIAVLGAWSQAKGSKQVLEFACLLRKLRPAASIHFYGCKYDATDDEFIRKNLPNFVWEGKYEIATLPGRLTKDRIAAVLFPSVCPETYSFVVHECMEMGVPLVGFGIGASGDAIKNYKYGRVVADFDITQILPAIDEVVRMRSCRDNGVKT